MNTERNFEYGYYADCLKECTQKFGSLHDLPIMYGQNKKIAELYQGGNVLDIGAGKEKPLQKNLHLSDEVYYSLDNDRSGAFHYRSIEDIPSSHIFSLIIASQFFEHLTLQESIHVVCNLYPHLEEGGYFISTVPNIAHPIRQRTNIDHVTSWEYKALYTLYAYGGFDVLEILRFSKRHPRGIIEKTLANYINAIYRVDWCDSIMLIGCKRE
ncbi:MAG: class I SAM-dependent methyltransferase [Candidatus Omnitrophica bacterium]|nr:class I SAM-dependent methyltransferase [Candidatus Omnitrophota bacterium]